MQPTTFVILLVTLIILFNTKQIFLVLIAGLLLLAYAISYTSRSVTRGIRRTTHKLGQTYSAEIAEMEKTTRKYPSKFFDSVGKAAVEKAHESMAPAGAKNYRDVENFTWKSSKNFLGLVSDSAFKIMDGLGKLFGK